LIHPAEGRPVEGLSSGDLDRLWCHGVTLSSLLSSRADVVPLVKEVRDAVKDETAEWCRARWERVLLPKHARARA